MTESIVEVHTGDCTDVQMGKGCDPCAAFEQVVAEASGHPESCWYTLKATAPERVEHWRTRLPECGGFWPDVTSHLAHVYGLSEERVRELRSAPRDEDGWPVGMSLTQPEYYMLQDSGDDLQETREKLATSDAIDFLADALKSWAISGTVDRGEDYVSFDHAGHHFTAEVVLDKDAS